MLVVTGFNFCYVLELTGEFLNIVMFGLYFRLIKSECLEMGGFKRFLGNFNV